MGMDSVDLLMEVEKYFGIAISNTEAETIYTIQHLVEIVARHRKINSEERPLQTSVLEQIKIKLNKNDVNLSDKIFPIIELNRNAFQHLSHLLELNIPYPNYINKKKRTLSDKILLPVFFTPPYKAEELSFESLVDAIVASNCNKLINHPSLLSNKYEIYIAIMAITVDRIGVDYYEINPDKSFTNDLGVD